MKFTGERYIGNFNNAQISYEHWHRYLFATEYVKNKKVLDIACGEGYGTHLLANYAYEIVGVDISEEAVEHARNTYRTVNSKFLVGSVNKIPITENHIFDVIISYETIEHVNATDQILFLLEVKRLLRKDGLFIVSTPDKYYYSDLADYKNEFHIKEFYRDEFYHFLKEYFGKTAVLGQQIFTGSAILNTESDKRNGMVPYYLNHIDNRFVLDDSGQQSTYLIAICSDIDFDIQNSLLVDNSMRLLKEKDESWLKEIKRNNDYHNGNIASLFIFLKDNSIINRSSELNNTHFNLTFDIKGISGIKYLRFDPTESKICRVKIISIKYESLQSGFIEYPLDELTSNGKLDTDGYFVFETLDPMIYIQVQDSTDLITIEGYRELAPLQKVDDLLRLKNEELDQKKEELNQKNEELNQKKEELIRVYMDLTQKAEEQIFVEQCNFEVISSNFSKIEDVFISEHFNKTFDIIIPVYNGLEYLNPLFESIFKNTDVYYNLIVINDASTDYRIADFLEKILTGKSNVKLIHNEVNLGFVKTINLGLNMSKNDVVILNTDIVVPPNWLSRLVKPLTNNLRIASVTPMSNSSTISSFPNIMQDNLLFENLELTEIDKIFKRVKSTYPVYIDTPTGVGFCMGISREALNIVGIFDEATFGKGYGEEVDWCMRAHKKGFRNVITPNLFVYHKNGGSFDLEEKVKLNEINGKIIFEKYPEYAELINQTLSNKVYKWIREFTLVLAANKVATRTLFVFDNNFGGSATEWLNNFVNENKGESLFLICRNIDGQYNITLELKNSQVVYYCTDIIQLFSFFDIIEIDEVLINELVNYKDLNILLENLINVKLKNNIKITYMLHDFYSLCISYNLFNFNGDWCGLPEQSECNQCFKIIKQNNCESRSYIETIADWRKLWQNLFNNVDEFVIFFPFVKNTFIKVHQINSDLVKISKLKTSKSFCSTLFYAEKIENFSENMKIISNEISFGLFSIEFEIPGDGFNFARFDPIEGSYIQLRIYCIYITDSSDQVENGMDYIIYSNGFSSKAKSWSFYNFDPRLIFNFRKKVKKIQILCEIISIDDKKVIAGLNSLRITTLRELQTNLSVLRKQDSELNQKDEELQQKNRVLNQKNEEIYHKIEEINQKEHELNQKNEEISQIMASRSWRITKPLRTIFKFLKNFTLILVV